MPVTDDPNDPRIGRGPPDEKPVEQNEAYLVLSEEERKKGFVRPVRQSYIHNVPECRAKTTMGMALAETYARDPNFYGSTYCCGCRMHRPVGLHGEFVWAGTNIRVGT